MLFSCSTRPEDCDFDDGFCGFTSTGTTWLRRSGYTPTGNGKTGPAAGVGEALLSSHMHGGHTHSQKKMRWSCVSFPGGAGSYLYAEADSNAFLTLDLDLHLPAALSGSGVTFFYHMYEGEHLSFAGTTTNVPKPVHIRLRVRGLKNTAPLYEPTTRPFWAGHLCGCRCALL